ncbi:MAG TPA: vWA domain-containing protein [Gaiellaceae bacterium]|jgi:hypothetical protein
MSLVFLTPDAGLVAFAAALPLVALVVAGRRIRRTRAALRLLAPPPVRILPRVLALAAVPALLGVAAAQPALRSQTTARVRTDAQAMFVLDISRSMRAAKGPGAATRLARAKREALAMRAAIPQVPSGIATFTDQVLPSLLPSADPAVFDSTVERAVAIEQPPPADDSVTATNLAALSVLGTGDYFPPSARKRLVVVLTDGESRAFDEQVLARALRGERLVLVHVWAPGEAVYDDGTLEQGYHEDPTSGTTLANLAAANGGTAESEAQLHRAIDAARADVGSGPTVAAARALRTRPLAPFIALLALLPLLGLARGERWRRVPASMRSLGLPALRLTGVSRFAALFRNL